MNKNHSSKYTNTTQKGLVSCICVTGNNLSFLKRAVDCFLHQTYKKKELIIVYEDNNPDARDFLSDLQHSRMITAYEVSTSPKLTLGDLRNFGIEKSGGEFFCQWDDDDWYHNKRIEYQVKTQKQSYKDSVLLSNWIMYDAINEEAYLSETRLWEGTILCRKTVFFNVGKYPGLSIEEDTGFVKKLFRDNLMYPLIMPTLYIYTVHGKNTWPKSHFEEIFKKSQKLSAAASLEIKKIVNQTYSNSKASKKLSGKKILSELNYLHSYL
jgi:glycosyltransferase involved in cell wall biosynthesis